MSRTLKNLAKLFSPFLVISLLSTGCVPDNLTAPDEPTISLDEQPADSSNGGKDKGGLGGD